LAEFANAYKEGKDFLYKDLTIRQKELLELPYFLTEKYDSTTAFIFNYGNYNIIFELPNNEAVPLCCTIYSIFLLDIRINHLDNVIIGEEIFKEKLEKAQSLRRTIVENY